MNYSKNELIKVKGDLWRVLNALPNEVLFLRDAIVNGRIEGGLYQDTDQDGKFCGCLIGTLVYGRGVDLRSSNRNLYSFDFDGYILTTVNPISLIETFVGHIHLGDTTENSPHLALLQTWVDEWIAEQAAQHEALQELTTALQSAGFFRQYVDALAE